jgi:CheY-like chemotaxis protein
MPGMSGEELVMALQKMKLPNEPVVVACTADYTSGIDDRCRDVGFYGVLRKPITIQNLEEFLARVITVRPERFT